MKLKKVLVIVLGVTLLSPRDDIIRMRSNSFFLIILKYFCRIRLGITLCKEKKMCKHSAYLVFVVRNWTRVVISDWGRYDSRLCIFSNEVDWCAWNDQQAQKRNFLIVFYITWSIWFSHVVFFPGILGKYFLETDECVVKMKIEDDMLKGFFLKKKKV